MGLISSFKQFAVVYPLMAYIFFVSGIICNIFQALGYLLIRPYSLSVYRKFTSCFIYLHWSQFVFLNEWWAGSTVNIYCADDDFGRFGKENAVVVLNHTFDTEMISGWTVCERLGVLGTSRAFIRDGIKYLPVVGWSMYFTEFIFLKRNYKEDKEVIVKQLKELQSYPDNSWLLLFCEGTRFTTEKHQKSMHVARSKGLPELRHHLLPRTKGFLLCAQGVRDYTFYDVELQFSKGGPDPTISELLKGQAQHAHFFVRRIPIEDVPEDEVNCAAYCHEIYKIKDRNFEYFQQNGRFPEKTHVLPRRPYALLVFILWFILLVVPLVKFLVDVLLSGSTITIAGVFLGGILVAVLLKKMIDAVSTGTKYGLT